MIAKLKIQTNWEEIEYSKELNLPNKIDPKYKYVEFGFRLSDVELYYLSENNDINIMIKGDSYILKSDPYILNILKTKFEN